MLFHTINKPDTKLVIPLLRKVKQMSILVLTSLMYNAKLISARIKYQQIKITIDYKQAAANAKRTKVMINNNTILY